MLYQQGDVLFRQIDVLPDGLKGRNNPILVRGEATGHHHAIATDNLAEMLPDILFEDDQGNLYIRNTSPVTITHQEHNPITLPPGKYQLDRVREYDHFAEEARRVQD